MDDEFGKLGGLFGDFSDAGSGVLADLDINVFETVENLGEDFSFNYDFCEVNSVLCNLS